MHGLNVRGRLHDRLNLAHFLGLIVVHTKEGERGGLRVATTKSN